MRTCSAELNSAVSPNCIRLHVGFSGTFGLTVGRAGCKPAIRQSTTLRYEGGSTAPQ